jgi:hypothetical protein
MHGGAEAFPYTLTLGTWRRLGQLYAMADLPAVLAVVTEIEVFRSIFRLNYF